MDRKTGAIVAAMSMSLFVTGCCVRAGEGTMHSEGHSSGGFNVEGKARGRLEVGARARGRAEGRASGQAEADADSAPTKSPPPAVEIRRAKRPVRFAGLIRAHNRGLRVAAERPRRAGRRPNREPSEEELEEPPPPPDEPPENVFGYDRPVLGCLEGQVYFIPANSRMLPESYDDLASSAVLYACEWDIPTRAWEQGFPGLEDRFEWFAIRYSGAFNVAQAGSYGFRISSDDGAKLTIDGQVVVDNDGVHPPRTQSGQIDLTAGDHTIVLEYFQGPRYHINLQVYVTPPGGEEGLFSVRSE